ncbi:putative DNA-binding protein [Quillaja saponaria]|uniref:DNA-binding protein n=1 Tax=Quillaja saponaria TaxID=32244 RepID=A0AAD7QG98_QUISA|nr:putative DNA-binding protein [Quillaja saponaria]
MSFQNKGFWTINSAEHINDGETAFDNPSKIETKRPLQWFVDAGEVELLPNKKQAVDDPNRKSSSGISNANFSPWESNTTFQSAPNQFIDRLLGSESRSVNCAEKNICYVATDDSNGRRNVNNNQYGEDASFGLSMSYAVEDSETCFNFGGIRKVKVNQVKDSENGLDDHRYNQENNSNLGHVSREREMSSRTMGQAYDKKDDGVPLRGHTNNRGDPHVRSVGTPYSKGDSSVIAIGDSFNKEDGKIISFGGFPDAQDIIPLGRSTGDYDPSFNQPSVQTTETASKEVLDVLNSNAVVNASEVAKLKRESVTKSKPDFKGAKKEAPNSFPSNVRSLISTGMLDGVPVKYVSLAREELRGIIKGSGYLCGCQSCNYTKVLNAYEFEQHAGCKTKHPNNHIYFENGKTIYQIVQELRSTPESLLFDTIQTVFGAPINQKSFRIWKESFQAATRELQRIYGKEELNIG